jgi:hypothetical protein
VTQVSIDEARFTDEQLRPDQLADLWSTVHPGSPDCLRFSMDVRTESVRQKVLRGVLPQERHCRAAC